jgi:sugar phosphate permease
MYAREAAVEAPGPPALAAPRVFYGWAMVPVATLAMISTSPGQSFGVGVFKPYFGDALGMADARVTLLYMIATALAAVPMFFFGWLMDRIGPRLTMLGAVAMVCLGCLVTARAAGPITLFLGFLLLRMFGQGALGMLAGNTLAMWFHRKLGVVQGIMTTGMAGSIMLMPMFILWLIEVTGSWRGAYTSLGLIVAAVMTPLLLFVYRNRPEDIGQLPDGEAPRDEAANMDEASTAPAPVGPSFTLGQAMKTRALWISAVCIGCWAFTMTAIFISGATIFESQGLGNDGASAAMARVAFAMGLALICSQFPAGMLADRLPMRWMMAAAALMLSVAVAILRLDQSHTLAMPLGVTMGLAQATTVAVMSTIWAKYFGRDHLGKIKSVVMTCLVAVSGMGPLVVDGVAELTGSYAGVLTGLMLAPLPLAGLALLAKPPRHPEVKA